MLSNTISNANTSAVNAAQNLSGHNSGPLNRYNSTDNISNSSNDVNGFRGEQIPQEWLEESERGNTSERVDSAASQALTWLYKAYEGVTGFLGRLIINSETTRSKRSPARFTSTDSRIAHHDGCFVTQPIHVPILMKSDNEGYELIVALEISYCEKIASRTPHATKVSLKVAGVVAEVLCTGEVTYPQREREFPMEDLLNFFKNHHHLLERLISPSESSAAQNELRFGIRTFFTEDTLHIFWLENRNQSAANALDCSSLQNCIVRQCTLRLKLDPQHRAIDENTFLNAQLSCITGAQVGSQSNPSNTADNCSSVPLRDSLWGFFSRRLDHSWGFEDIIKIAISSDTQQYAVLTSRLQPDLSREFVISALNRDTLQTLTMTFPELENYMNKLVVPSSSLVDSSQTLGMSIVGGTLYILWVQEPSIKSESTKTEVVICDFDLDQMRPESLTCFAYDAEHTNNSRPITAGALKAEMPTLRFKRNAFSHDTQYVAKNTLAVAYSLVDAENCRGGRDNSGCVIRNNAVILEARAPNAGRSTDDHRSYSMLPTDFRFLSSSLKAAQITLSTQKLSIATMILQGYTSPANNGLRTENIVISSVCRYEENGSETFRFGVNCGYQDNRLVFFTQYSPGTAAPRLTGSALEAMGDTQTTIADQSGDSPTFNSGFIAVGVLPTSIPVRLYADSYCYPQIHAHQYAHIAILRKRTGDHSVTCYLACYDQNGSLRIIHDRSLRDSVVTVSTYDQLITGEQVLSAKVEVHDQAAQNTEFSILSFAEGKQGMPVVTHGKATQDGFSDISAQQVCTDRQNIDQGSALATRVAKSLTPKNRDCSRENAKPLNCYDARTTWGGEVKLRLAGDAAEHTTATTAAPVNTTPATTPKAPATAEPPVNTTPATTPKATTTTAAPVNTTPATTPKAPATTPKAPATAEPTVNTTPATTPKAPATTVTPVNTTPATTPKAPATAEPTVNTTPATTPKAPATTAAPVNTTPATTPKATTAAPVNTPTTPKAPATTVTPVNTTPATTPKAPATTVTPVNTTPATTPKATATTAAPVNTTPATTPKATAEPPVNTTPATTPKATTVTPVNTTSESTNSTRGLGPDEDNEVTKYSVYWLLLILSPLTLGVLALIAASSFVCGRVYCKKHTANNPSRNRGASDIESRGQEGENFIRLYNILGTPTTVVVDESESGEAQQNAAVPLLPASGEAQRNAAVPLLTASGEAQQNAAEPLLPAADNEELQPTVVVDESESGEAQQNAAEPLLTASEEGELHAPPPEFQDEAQQHAAVPLFPISEEEEEFPPPPPPMQDEAQQHDAEPLLTASEEEIPLPPPPVSPKPNNIALASQRVTMATRVEGNTAAYDQATQLHTDFRRALSAKLGERTAMQALNPASPLVKERRVRFKNPIAEFKEPVEEILLTSEGELVPSTEEASLSSPQPPATVRAIQPASRQQPSSLTFTPRPVPAASPMIPGDISSQPSQPGARLNPADREAAQSEPDPDCLVTVAVICPQKPSQQNSPHGGRIRRSSSNNTARSSVEPALPPPDHPSSTSYRC